MQTQTNLQQEKNIGFTLRQCLVLLLLTLVLTACDQATNPSQGVISGDELSTSFPKDIAALLINGSNLIVDIVVDGDTNNPLRVENLVVDTTTGTFSGNVPSFPAGTYTLSLVYSITDPTQGTVEVARTAEITVNVVANEDTPADFSSASLTYTDTDGDTISNLDELAAGTDINTPDYTVGGEVEGLMGSGLVLQNNGGDDLTISTNGAFTFNSTVVNDNNYAVTVLTQPTDPTQVCTINNGTGTINDIAASDVGVACNTAPTASDVTITDTNGSTIVVGDPLNGSYTYADNDNDPEDTSTFRWLRNGSAISGATSRDYTLQAADSGQSITFEVTPVATTGIPIGSATVSGAVMTANSAPTTGSVTIIDDNGGTAVVGDRLSGSYTYVDIDGDTEGTSTFRWLRDDNAISGATSRNYTLTLADELTQITFEVTPIAVTGTLTGSPVTSTSIAVSDTPPAVNITTSITSFDPTFVPPSFTATITFSEAVTGFAAGDITLDNATVTNFTTVNAMEYTVSVLPTNNTDVTLRVPANVASDTASNGNTISATVTVNAVDATAPVANITFPPPVSLTEGNNIVVRGTANDASPITMLRVNGVEASTSDGYATWSAPVALAGGPNTLIVEVGDIALNNTANANQALIDARGPALVSPLSLALDSANNRVLVLMDGLNAVVAVDLNSGARTIVSDSSTPDAVNAFSAPLGLVLDSANNRLLVTDAGLDAVVAMDLNSGARTIISDSTTPNGTNAFSVPFGLALDSANNRVLVVDADLYAVVAVDLNSGARTIISDDDTPNGGSFFAIPRGLVLDSANNRVLVADELLRAVVAVDLNSGVRTIISDNNTPNGDNRFSWPRDLVLDSANNRVLVTDWGLNTLVAVDLNSGARTIVSDSTTPNEVNAFSGPRGLVLDSANNRVLVVDANLDPDFQFDLNLDAVVAVNLNNGARTIVSDNSTPNGLNVFSWPQELALDSINNRVLVVDSDLRAVVAMDLNSGARTIVSDNSTPNGVNAFSNPYDLVPDSANNRLLVVDRGLNAVVAVDPNSGARTIISNSTTPNGVNAFSFPVSLVLDSTNNRVLVTDLNLDAVVAVNLNSGARTIISNSSTPNGVNAFSTPRDLVLDSANNRLLVVDTDLDAVVAVNLDNGVRTIISNNSTPNGVNAFSYPRGLILDSANNRVLVVDEGLGAVIAVDLVNGQRVIFSR